MGLMRDVVRDGRTRWEYSADGGETWHASMEAAQSHARLDDFERWCLAPADDTRTFDEFVAGEPLPGARQYPPKPNAPPPPPPSRPMLPPLREAR